MTMQEALSLAIGEMKNAAQSHESLVRLRPIPRPGVDAIHTGKAQMLREAVAALEQLAEEQP